MSTKMYKISYIYILPKRTSYYIFKGGDFMRQIVYSESNIIKNKYWKVNKISLHRE